MARCSLDDVPVSSLSEKSAGILLELVDTLQLTTPSFTTTFYVNYIIACTVTNITQTQVRALASIVLDKKGGSLDFLRKDITVDEGGHHLLFATDYALDILACAKNWYVIIYSVVKLLD